MITDREKYLMLWTANNAKHFINGTVSLKNLDEFLARIVGQYNISGDYEGLLDSASNDHAKGMQKNRQNKIESID